MNPVPTAPIRTVLPFTRAVFLLSVLLAGIAGVQLYVLADRTDRYFAWTIGNPLSAAFLGTGFWAGTLLLVFSIRERAWANVRVAMAAVVTFVPLVVATTFMHLGPFHLHSSDLGARIAAWAWIVVYTVVPFAILAFIVLQLRAPGGDPPVASGVPLWIRALLTVNGITSLLVGVALMLVPERLFAYWPWQLTVLTAQTTGSGFLAIAVASLWFVRENAWVRGRVGTVSYLLVGVLQLVALGRFHASAEWGRAGAWLYLLYLLGIVIGGVYSTLMVWRFDPHRRVDVAADPRQA